ncbi:MAG: FHA domain-containing protein [Gammaproteobacteria bacterium]|nr:FHA domain-containing protein [Gammaproteobacteria bacterium]MDQ7075396.1 FHA domain-containing protein [Gammaproteobacteria bacterium]
MSKLILSLGGDTLGEYQLSKEHIVIGRKSGNEIQIDNLSVSGAHAKIITILNDSFLEDLNSTNGTYVNGSLIKRHALQDGDIISIGKHQLKYAKQGHPMNETDVHDRAKTMQAAGIAEVFPNAEDGETAGRIGTQASPDIYTYAARLQVVSGKNRGKKLQLTKALTTVGKPGKQVAAITRRPHGYFIIHVEGGKGAKYPSVNGQLIGTQAQALSDKDVIEVAGVKMEFVLNT